MKTSSLIQAVAYSMECALATIESEADKKKPSKSVINRHIAIVRNVLIDTLAAAESPEEAAYWRKVEATGNTRIGCYWRQLLECIEEQPNMKVAA